jgi:hypothetical protein
MKYWTEMEYRYALPPATCHAVTAMKFAEAFAAYRLEIDDARHR